MSLFDIGRPEYGIRKKIRLIELFAGIGAQAMALRDLGADFERYRVVEIDKFALASYNAIHGTAFAPTDIREMRGEDLGIVDTDRYEYIMTYSFPCVDLSFAGRRQGMRRGNGTRSGLLWEVERLLSECGELPQVLVMENVPAVHSRANMPDFMEWVSFLDGMGYSSRWKDLNARDFGVAQNRVRCFMVSILGDYSYEFPLPIPLEKRLRDYMDEEVDEKYYLSGESADRLIAGLAERGMLDGGEGDAFMEGNNYNQRKRVHRTGGESRTVLGNARGNEPKVLVPEGRDGE